MKLAPWVLIPSAIITAIAVIGGYVSRPVKQLDVERAGRESLTREDLNPLQSSRLADRISPTQPLTRFHFRVRNSGNIDISRDDLMEPLTLLFWADTVLEASLPPPRFTGLAVDIEATHSAVLLRWSLLYKDEYFDVEVLCEGAPDWPGVSARIKGLHAAGAHYESDIAEFDSGASGNEEQATAHFEAPSLIYFLRYPILIAGCCMCIILVFGGLFGAANSVCGLFGLNNGSQRKRVSYVVWLIWWLVTFASGVALLYGVNSARNGPLAG